MTNDKVKSVVVFNEIQLAATELATQAVADRVIVDTFFSKTLNFVAKYTTSSTISASSSPSSSASSSVSPSSSASSSISPSSSVSRSASSSPSSSASISISSSISNSASSSASSSASTSLSASSSASSSASTSLSASSSVSSSASSSISSSASSSASSSISSSASSSASSSISSSASASISPSSSISSSASTSLSSSPSAVISSCYIKVWGYNNILAQANNFPYSSATNADIENDTNNWVQLGEYAISNGTATFTPTVFQIEGADEDTTYVQHFSMDICFPKIRFTAYDDAIQYNRGKLTLVALVQ